MMGMMASATVGGEHMDMRAMMRSGLAWAVNGIAATGHVHDPAVILRRGRSYIFDLRNETAWWNPNHLHGHVFRVIDRNGAPNTYREWQDTVLSAPNDRKSVE